MVHKAHLRRAAVIAVVFLCTPSMAQAQGNQRGNRRRMDHLPPVHCAVSRQADQTPAPEPKAPDIKANGLTNLVVKPLYKDCSLADYPFRHSDAPTEPGR